MPRVLHVVSMQKAAGVEAHFAEFVSRAAVRDPEWRQLWLNPARTLHPFFETPLARGLGGSSRLKYRWGMKLPSRPQLIRTWHCRREIAAAGPDVIVIWNRSANLGPVLAAGKERCIHWEHGSAWFAGRERERLKYFERIPLAIANSRAAARVLELMWNYRGSVRVCRNALRPSLLPETPIAKPLPREGKLRLGVAARLEPVKGVPLVLHTLRHLRDRGLDVELDVAGAGPGREGLEALAARLGVGGAVRFRGSVSNMGAFYAGIHALVHLPLTEAFGLVTIEAAARGVPVIAAAVDGLPEAVVDGVMGACVAPELSIDDYVALGGSREGLPDRIYDPAADALAAPRAVDPAAAADAVLRLVTSSADYEKRSRVASEYARSEYRFDAHVDQVMGVIAEAAVRFDA